MLGTPQMPAGSCPGSGSPSPRSSQDVSLNNKSEVAVPPDPSAIPPWLHALSIASLVIALLTASGIALDLLRRPQRMGIMNLVWPLSALFGSVAVLWLYWTYGRADDRKKKEGMGYSVATGALHCGSGCTLGDISAEWLAVAFPAIATWFGWPHLFHDRMFAVWVLDFLFAFAFGIVFQYYSVAPMRGLSLRDGIIAAFKADTLSLTAWQVGMYGFMAIAIFLIFRPLFGVMLQADSVEFWFMMQIAMLFGFATAYPVNWWLIRKGIKEAM